MSDKKEHIIGLHMIVRNCADELGECLKSAEGLYDVLSITDTGSTDGGRTVDMAKSKGAHVSYYKSRDGWNYSFIDDFGAARQISLRAIADKCDWLIFLDSDDIVQDPIGIRRILKGLDPRQKQLISIPYLWSKDMNYMHERIWSKGSCHWWGRVHEAPRLTQNGVRVDIVTPPIIHNQTSGRKHTSRNLTILEDTIKTDRDPRYVFYFAKELTYARRFEEAIAWFQYYINNPSQIDFERNRTYYELGMCYYNLRQNEKAIEFLYKAIMDCDEYAEPFILMGRIYADKKKYREAIPWFQHASSMPSPSRGWFDYKSFRTYTPLEWISLCYYYIGEKDLSKHYHLKAKSFQPGNRWLIQNDKWHTYCSLEKMYLEYITSVPDPSMVISLELSQLIYVICEMIKPQKILDNGSGWSSVLFRKICPHAHIISTDDNVQWAQRTQEIMRKFEIEPAIVKTWNTIIKKNKRDFDFILHDLGSMQTRVDTLEETLSRLSVGGYALLDDINFNRYAERAFHVIEKLKLKVIKSDLITRDEVFSEGNRRLRYGLLVKKEEEVKENAD